MIKVLVLSLIISMSALFAQVYFASSWQNEAELYQAKCDSLQFKVDSLGSEIFILNTNVMRYEIAVEMLEDENPKAASEFYKCLSQTE